MLSSGSLDTSTDEIIDPNILDATNSQDISLDEDGYIPNGHSPKLGGFSFNFYKKNSLSASTPSSSPVNRSKIEASYHKIRKKNDDRINKGVSHKIRKPKVLKKKEVRKNRAKQSCSRLREVKMPPRIPANRCPLKPGDKSKRHQLSSPGISLLECPDPAHESSQEIKKKFFTTRSRDPATIQISKTIKLAALDGSVTMTHRIGGFEKKNIGHTIERELEKKIAATSLNSPSNGLERLDQIAQMSSSCLQSPRPIPTRFPGSPSPRKNKLSFERLTTSYKSPVRSSPRRQLKAANTIVCSPSKLRKSPRKKIELAHFDSNSKQNNLNSQNLNCNSPLRLKRSSATNDKFNIGEDLEDLEDLDLVLDNMCSSQHEEDEILSSLIKENVSPDKVINSPRRSFRKINSSSPICSPKRSNLILHEEPSLTSPRCSPRRSSANFMETKEKTLLNLSILPEKNELIDDSLTDLQGVTTHLNTKNVKYFPIFDSGRKNKDLASNLGEKALKRSPQKRLLLKKSDISQMVLDAGQKEFGATFCKSCGLMYEIGDPDDEASHMRYHDKVMDALKFNGWKNEKQVTNIDYLGGRIIKISPKDPNYQWKKIEEVLKCVDSDLGFSENGIKRQESTYAYLYILDKLVIGCLIAETIEKAYKVIQTTTTLTDSASEKLICCSEDPQKVCLGISRIWVLSKYRRKGVASQLVDTMRANFIMGHYLTISQFAFSDPTQFGMAFAEKYSKRSDFLVYRRENQ